MRSDRHGVRVVVEIKRDAMAEVVLNQLYKFTPLQSSFGVNMLAHQRRPPELMNLKQILIGRSSPSAKKSSAAARFTC